MRLGSIDLVVVGADRIAANGDVANKIGTYSVAVLANEHRIPFYVAAPLSTIDLNTPDGGTIPIEERSSREVTHVGIRTDDARGRTDPQPRLRRDTGTIRHGDHHGAWHRPATLSGVSGSDGESPITSDRRSDRSTHSPMVDPRHRDLLRRDCGRPGGGDRRSTAPMARAIERRLPPRSSCIVNGAAWCPELSARQHVRDICGVVERALVDGGDAGYDAIAVTQGPGLVGSLLVGLSFAKSLAWARGVPVIPVNHLAGHIESLVLENGEMPLPAVVLVVSGGHTSLYRVGQPGATSCSVARAMMRPVRPTTRWPSCSGWAIPAGRWSIASRGEGHDRAILFPKTRLTHADRNAPHLPGRRDFSFSGLKTSVLRHVSGAARCARHSRRTIRCRAESDGHLRELSARGGRRRCSNSLFDAAERHGAQSVGIAGGVSANGRLRAERATRACARAARVHSEPVAVHRQRGHDCGGRPARSSVRGDIGRGWDGKRRCGAAH